MQSSNGQLVMAGDIIRDEIYGNTLKIIRDDPDSFYTGNLSKAVLADIADEEGTVSEEDLRNYTPKFKQPVRCPLLNNYVLYTLSPPSRCVPPKVLQIQIFFKCLYICILYSD